MIQITHWYKVIWFLATPSQALYLERLEYDKRAITRIKWTADLDKAARFLSPRFAEELAKHLKAKVHNLCMIG